MINWIRTVKSESELKYMRQAGAVTEKAMNIGISALAEGVRECDVAADIWHAQIAGTKEFGGEYPGLMPAICGTTHPWPGRCTSAHRTTSTRIMSNVYDERVIKIQSWMRNENIDFCVLCDPDTIYYASGF